MTVGSLVRPLARNRKEERERDNADESLGEILTEGNLLRERANGNGQSSSSLEIGGNMRARYRRPAR